MFMYTNKTTPPVAKMIKDSAILLRDNQDLDAILDSIDSNVKVVMIGEASHGTHDFYQMRAELTKRLIAERGFNMVTAEADWPDTYRVNKFVKNMNTRDKTSVESLSDYDRFPRWMWRNLVVTQFLDWLRSYNDSHFQQQDYMKKVGFYGLDMYSLNGSLDAVIKYFDSVDKEKAEIARQYYSCFDRFGGDSQFYGSKTGKGLDKGCEKEVLQVIRDLFSRKSQEMFGSSDTQSQEDYFCAQINATVVRDAERYYRNMFDKYDGENTWNIRDTHMLKTLVSLLGNYPNGKAVVWAHNSHLGDASETAMGARREVNLGQLVRGHFGMDQCYNIGFTTYNGTVTAAHNWDKDPQFMPVNPGMEGSYEKLFHDALPHMNIDMTNPLPYALIFRGLGNQNHVAHSDLIRELTHKRLERAIGVIYRPKTERYSHYFQSCLPRQFDAVIHIETTLALFPLELHPQWITGQREHAPSAYPGIAHLDAKKYEFEGFFDPSHYDFGPDFMTKMHDRGSTSQQTTNP